MGAGRGIARGAAAKGRLKRLRLFSDGLLPHQNVYSPAAAFNAAALSVRSQVNSGSSRPKWPYAADLL